MSTEILAPIGPETYCPALRPDENGVMAAAAPHDPSACQGRNCAWHNPSQHHMRDWPLIWRPYRGRSDRICPHGVGHPDPDDVLDLQALGGGRTDHVCDGCCIAPLRAER
jgi:hypothetical protein